MTDLSILREFVRNQIRGIYTITFVRVEEVNENDRRVVVSKKSASDILIDNVPVASTFAADGAGEIVPIERGAEGFIMHPQEPLERQIQQRGEQPAGSDRRFQLEDAVFFPQVWLDEDSVPDHDPGEYLLAHSSGSNVRIRPDGELRLEHDAGHALRIDDEGIHVDGPLFIEGEPYAEHDHDFEYSWTDQAGSDSGTTDAP